MPEDKMRGLFVYVEAEVDSADVQKSIDKLGLVRVDVRAAAEVVIIAIRIPNTFEFLVVCLGLTCSRAASSLLAALQKLFAWYCF